MSPYNNWTFLILKVAPLNGRAWLRAKTGRQAAQLVVLSRTHLTKGLVRRAKSWPQASLSEEERMRRMIYCQRLPMVCC